MGSGDRVETDSAYAKHMHTTSGAYILDKQ